MKASELIEKLQEIQKEHGDLRVVCVNLEDPPSDDIDSVTVEGGNGMKWYGTEKVIELL